MDAEAARLNQSAVAPARTLMVSAGVSTRGALRACEQPALLIQRSRPPSRCTANSARASTADSSRTSHARPCTPLWDDLGFSCCCIEIVVQTSPRSRLFSTAWHAHIRQEQHGISMIDGIFQPFADRMQGYAVQYAEHCLHSCQSAVPMLWLPMEAWVRTDLSGKRSWSCATAADVRAASLLLTTCYTRAGCMAGSVGEMQEWCVAQPGLQHLDGALRRAPGRASPRRRPARGSSRRAPARAP